MAAFSAAAPWRGHPRAASPENTISVHQSEQGHQGITGAGLKGKQEGRAGLDTFSLFQLHQSFHGEEALPGAHVPLSRFGHHLSKE